MGGRGKVAPDGVGFAVQTLTRDAALLGVLSDVAMRAEEDNRSAGEAVQGRYDAHGVRTCSNAVGGSSALLQRLTPLLSAPTPRFQDGFEKVPSAEGAKRAKSPSVPPLTANGFSTRWSHDPGNRKQFR